MYFNCLVLSLSGSNKTMIFILQTGGTPQQMIGLYGVALAPYSSTDYIVLIMYYLVTLVSTLCMVKENFTLCKYLQNDLIPECDEYARVFVFGNSNDLGFCSGEIYKVLINNFYRPFYWYNILEQYKLQ